MSSQSRMRALFKRLSRRLALPSVLMGLVVFSFTLLFFGAAVYTAALPSLVANAEQSDGAYAQIASGALLEALTETPGDDSSQGNAGTSSSHQGGVTSSGRVVSGVGGVTGGVSTPITSTDDSTEDSDHEGDSDKDSNATPPQDGGGGNLARERTTTSQALRQMKTGLAMISPMTPRKTSRIMSFSSLSSKQSTARVATSTRSMRAALHSIRTSSRLQKCALRICIAVKQSMRSSSVTTSPL